MFWIHWKDSKNLSVPGIKEPVLYVKVIDVITYILYSES